MDAKEKLPTQTDLKWYSSLTCCRMKEDFEHTSTLAAIVMIDVEFLAYVFHAETFENTSCKLTGMMFIIFMVKMY